MNSGYRKVSKEEFWDAVGPQDVICRLSGDYPYRSTFEARGSRNIKGIIEQHIVGGPPKSTYYLPTGTPLMIDESKTTYVGD